LKICTQAISSDIHVHQIVHISLKTIISYIFIIWFLILIHKRFKHLKYKNIQNSFRMNHTTFPGHSVSLSSALLNVENWVPLKPVLGSLRDVALFYYLSCINSIAISM
jgi:hypothetical protein